VAHLSTVAGKRRLALACLLLGTSFAPTGCRGPGLFDGPPGAGGAGGAGEDGARSVGAWRPPRPVIDFAAGASASRGEHTAITTATGSRSAVAMSSPKFRLYGGIAAGPRP
jgi:hypothetical protein